MQVIVLSLKLPAEDDEAFVDRRHAVGNSPPILLKLAAIQ